jgi:hypothetical protein
MARTRMADRIMKVRTIHISPYSTQWAWIGDWWRFKVALFMYRHRSDHCGDRWVFHPRFTYDRKSRVAS